MPKHNILIYDDQAMLASSISKLFVTISKILTHAGFKVYLAYSSKHGKAMKPFFNEAGVELVPFTYEYRQEHEPHTLVGMNPSIEEIVTKYNIHCIHLCVFAHYQYPLNRIPGSIPFVLVSPFGHYTSNGNVPKTYVSGQSNLNRLLKRGVKNAQVFFNPLADVPPEYLVKSEVGEQVIFGRLGRPDNGIFDPIAVQAFKKLEDLYGNKVKYIVVSAPPNWIKLAEDLGIKNIEYHSHIVDLKDLYKFYQEIDVFAHSRIDGETVGNAIAEAMLSGNPILTHRSRFHNDHFDLLDASYARWSEPEDVETYFKNMVWMVEHKSQIRAMGQLARKKALSIFDVEAQRQGIVKDFTAACEHYYNDTFLGKVKGYAILYWQNLKAMPFVFGKYITYKFPGAYPSLRKLFPK